MRHARRKRPAIKRDRTRAGRVSIALLLIGSAAVPIARASSMPGLFMAGDQVVIEDQAKHVSLRPPEGWFYDPSSSAERLVFSGPKGGGLTASLTVEALLDGRSLEVAQPEILARLLGRSPAAGQAAAEGAGLGSDLVIEPLETKDLPNVDRAVSVAHKVKRKKVRSVVAMTRNGPYLIVVAFRIGESLYQRYEPAIRECLAGLTPMPLRPAYQDRAMGISFYELPQGFTLEEKATKPGSTVSWILQQDGRSLGELSAGVRPPLKGDFALWADSQARNLEKDTRVRDVEMHDFYLSGKKGVLIEYVVAFQGGSLLNTRRQIAVPGNRRVYTFSCSAETNSFEDHLRPVFERFFRSITIDE